MVFKAKKAKKKSMRMVAPANLPPLNKVKSKEQARDIAINWQFRFSERKMFMSDLVEAQSYFETLGKRFGLTKEFRENGII